MQYKDNIARTATNPMRLSVAFSLAAFSVCTASYAAPAPQTIPSPIFATPQKLVAVEGQRRLNFYCVGTGMPSVLLDAGAGGGMLDWRHVQGQIGGFTKTCAYDRAGHGWSDPASRPSDVANTVDDMHRLLKAANIATPIVYVGHSIAGLYGVYFAAKYPRDVAGAVLVDPSFAHQTEAMMADLTSAPRAMMQKMRAANMRLMRSCLDLARRGELGAPNTNSATDCLDSSSYPDKLDDILTAEELRESKSVPINEAVTSEYASFFTNGNFPDADDTELDSVKADFGGKMLIILTHGKTRPAPPGIDPKQMAPIDAAWKDGHDRLARLSIRGSNIIVPNADHYIQYDQPQAVIDAVRRVVMDVRAHS